MPLFRAPAIDAGACFHEKNAALGRVEGTAPRAGATSSQAIAPPTVPVVPPIYLIGKRAIPSDSALATCERPVHMLANVVDITSKPLRKERTRVAAYPPARVARIPHVIHSSTGNLHASWIISPLGTQPMIFHLFRFLAPAPWLVVFLLACGGKESGRGASSGSSSGAASGSSSGAAGAGGGSSTGTSAGASGAASGSSSASSGISSSGSSQPMCVDIDLSTYDQSCQSPSDCIVVAGGRHCVGQCLCGGATVNRSEGARYQSAIAGLSPGVCGCPAEVSPSCLGNRCTLCSGTASDPPECAVTDGGACVEIVPTNFDQSCAVASDCVEIVPGTVCPDTCPCGGATIASKDLGRYQALTAGLLHGECPCPFLGTPTCVQNQCINCGGIQQLNPPSGCGDDA